MPDQPIDPGVTLYVAARVFEVVDEPKGDTLSAHYDRNDVVELFGQHWGPA